MKVVGFGDLLIHFSPMMNERFAQSRLVQMSFTGAEANVCASLGHKKPEDDLDALALLKNISGMDISYPLKDLDKRTILFNKTVDPAEMLDAVKEYINA